MNRAPETPSHGGRRPLYRVALVSFGLLAGLVITEFALLVTGAPRFYEPHRNPPQFGFFPSRFGDGRDQRTGAWVYVNRPSHHNRFCQAR